MKSGLPNRVGSGDNQQLEPDSRALLRRFEMTNMTWSWKQTHKHHTGIGGAAGA